MPTEDVVLKSGRLVGFDIVDHRSRQLREEGLHLLQGNPTTVAHHPSAKLVRRTWQHRAWQIRPPTSHDQTKRSETNSPRRRSPNREEQVRKQGCPASLARGPPPEQGRPSTPREGFACHTRTSKKWALWALWALWAERFFMLHAASRTHSSTEYLARRLGTSIDSKALSAMAGGE